MRFWQNPSQNIGFVVFLCFFLSGCTLKSEEVEFSYLAYQDHANLYDEKNFQDIPFEKKNDLELGFFKGTLWIKVSIHNPLPEKQSVVIHNDDRLNRTYALYDISNGSCERAFPENQGRDDRSFNFVKPNFVVELDTNQSSVFLIRVIGDGRVLMATPYVSTFDSYVDYIGHDSAADFLFYGAVIIVLIINVFYAITLRRRIYLFYIPYLVFMSLFYLGIEGKLFDQGVDNHIVDHAIFFFARIWIICLFLFTLILFETKRLRPRFYAYCKWYMIIVPGTLTLYQLIFFQTSISHLHVIQNISGFISVVTVLLVVVLSYKKKKLESRPYIFTISLFIVLYLLSIVSVADHSVPWAVSTFLKVGTSIEFLIFTYTIARSNKRNILEKQKLLDTIDAMAERNAFTKKDVPAIFKLLESNITNDSDWEKFKAEYNTLDTEFLPSLMKKHPDLTKTEIRLITLIRIGYTQKEMANILFISTNGVKKSRQRIRKKMLLPVNTKLNEYVSNI